MKILMLVFLAGLILPHSALAKEKAKSADPKIDISGVSLDSKQPSRAQHHQTDSQFLTERARRSETVNALAAELEAIQMRSRALSERLRALENAETGSSTPDHILLGRQVGTPSANDGERRIPQTLKHRDRALSEVDDFGRIKVKLSAIGEAAQSELEKLQEPAGDAGLHTGQAGSESADSQAGRVTFGDGVRGRRLPGTENTDTADKEAAAESSQETVKQLQLDLDALETEIEDLERQDDASGRKKPGRLK